MISKIDCRLFIEGVQIPFNSLTINATVNQSSICTIEIAPSEVVRKLSPRSQILIVFLEDKIWRVLWEGEFRGWGMTKSSSAVSMQITAMDYSNGFGFMTRNIVDNISANTQTYAMLHTGVEASFSAAGGATFADSVNKTLADNSGKLVDLFLKIVDTVYNSIPYFSYYNLKNKIMERIKSIPDDQISALLSNNVANDYMTGIIKNRFTGNVSFDQILNYFLEVIGYIRVPMIAPSAFEGTSPIALFKPYGHFCTPPVSNCLFPDMYHTISGLGIDYLTEPTRIVMTAQETPTTVNGVGYTPMWMFNESTPHLPVSNTGDELMNSFLSDDEVNKGIFPYQKNINYEQTLNIRRGDADFASMKASMQGYAYYEYVKAKFAHRTCQVSCVFHPFAIVGFPGAIFDANQSFFGMIESISHTISADGHAGTTLGFSHVYPADRTEVSEAGVLYSPPLPRWLSQAYRPKGCDATYKKLFGSNSSGHAALGGPNIKSPSKPTINPLNDSKYIFDNDQVNIAEIASTVFTIPRTISASLKKESSPLYSGNNANAETAYNYTRREIISLSQYMTALNIGKMDDAELLSLPAILSQKADIYMHPQKFTYSNNSYSPTGTYIARRQANAILLQADLINVTGKLGK